MALVRTDFFSSLVTWSVVNLTGSSTAAGQGAQGGRPGRWWRPQLPAASMMTINTGAAQVSVEPSRLLCKEMNLEPHLTYLCGTFAAATEPTATLPPTARGDAGCRAGRGRRGRGLCSRAGGQVQHYAFRQPRSTDGSFVRV